MRTLTLALLLLIFNFITAIAQVIQSPPPGGTAITGCVYNAAPPTLANGQAGYVQCNNTGGVNVNVTGTNQTSDRLVGPTTVNAVNNAVVVNTQGTATASIVITSNTNVTLIGEVTTDGTNWVTTNLIPQACGTNITSISSGTTGTWYASTGGFQQLRVRVTAVGATPTATISLDAGAGDNNVCITQAVQAATITLGQTTKVASVPVTIASDQFAGDPCSSASGIIKSSVAINVTSATTTSIVATSGSTTVYVCGFSITIAPSATSADTALFERGTGAACVTTQTALTGTFGAGDLTTTAPPAVVTYGGAGQTIFKSAGSDAICLVSAGTSVNIQGVLTYVQQ